MEGKYWPISPGYEEFLICFCGKIPSGSVEWYVIDVSVEESCLSEKTESRTRELTPPFSVAEHLPSYAALDGLIYSLGGQRRSYDGGDTLLNNVWLLDLKSLEDLKPGSIPSLSFRDKHAPALEQEILGLERKASKLRVEDREPNLAHGLKPGAYKLGRGTDKVLPGDLPMSLGYGSLDEPWLLHKESLKLGRGADKVPGLKPPKVLDKEQLEYDKDPKLLVPGLKPDSDSASSPPLTAPSIEDWKPGLPMNFARYNPHTMVVDHKLYVLGGFLPDQNQADGWIEVFDPEEKKWESLPSPPDQIHSSIMISGLLNSKKEIIIARQRWDCHPLLFYSYNITTRCWNELSLHSDSKASDHSNVERAVILPPNIGRAVTVDNTLYWISTEEHNHECTIHAYDLDRNMWFEDHLNTATIFGRREHFSSIYSRGPGFLHLVDQKFCLLLQSTVTKKDPQSSIEYLYCVILDISPIYDHEHEDWGKFELTTVSVQKYSMDHYIHFLDCMLLDRVSGVKTVDRRGLSTITNISIQKALGMSHITEWD